MEHGFFQQRAISAYQNKSKKASNIHYDAGYRAGYGDGIEALRRALSEEGTHLTRRQISDVAIRLLETP